MVKKDYYQVLGVDEKADATAIKRVYRRLAKKCHPDAHPGDKQAEIRFKEISEAYNVLSDDGKRKRYDQMRRFGFGGQPGGYPQSGFDFNDIWGVSPKARRRKQRPGDFDGDELFGFGGLGDLFAHIFDKQPNSRNFNNGNISPNDIQVTLEVPFETAALGGKVNFRVPPKHGKGFSLNISAGTESGKKLRLAGQGRISMNGFPPGDLIVTVKLLEHRFFKLKGLDIYCEIPLDRRMAHEGTTVRVKTIHGNTVELTIPPETRQGKTFRLKELGVKDKERRGDQYVKIKLKKE